MTGHRFITREIEGESVQFHKMTPYDRFDFAERAKKRAREEMNERLRGAQATRDELIATLAQFDAARPQTFFYRFIDTPEGRLRTYEHALVKAGAPNHKVKELLEKFTPTEDEDEELLMELWGIPKQEKKDDPEATPENPTSPGAGSAEKEDPMNPDTFES